MGAIRVTPNKRGRAGHGRRRGYPRDLGRGAARQLFKYAAELRSLTGGQGSFTLEFDRYDIVPSNVAQRSSPKRPRTARMTTRTKPSSRRPRGWMCQPGCASLALGYGSACFYRACRAVRPQRLGAATCVGGATQSCTISRTRSVCSASIERNWSRPLPAVNRVPPSFSTVTVPTGESETAAVADRNQQRSGIPVGCGPSVAERRPGQRWCFM